MGYEARLLRAAGVQHASGRVFKAYELAAAGQAIDGPLREAAWAVLPELTAEPVDDATPLTGWCVLHRGHDGAYLVAHSWVWGVVIEARTAVAGFPALGAGGREVTDFGILARPWAGCVWELAPLAHERNAWVTHILDPPVPDLAAYLSDRLPDGSY